MTTSTAINEYLDEQASSSGQNDSLELEGYSNLAMRKLLRVASKQSEKVDFEEENFLDLLSEETNIQIIDGKIISSNRDERVRPRYKIIQEWEGVVNDVEVNKFTAILSDLEQNYPATNEIAELPMEDLSESDKIKARPGAIFRWTIGYQIFGTQKKRFSQIIFRDLPGFTTQQIERAKKRAKLMVDNLPNID